VCSNANANEERVREERRCLAKNDEWDPADAEGGRFERSERSRSGARAIEGAHGDREARGDAGERSKGAVLTAAVRSTVNFRGVLEDCER
jgi:hypothetical protein